MGQTRVLFTDATTAEAQTVLKSIGYSETADGGCFLNRNSPVKIYSIWGKADYYPEILKKLSFTPRVQIHIKCREQGTDLTKIARDCAAGLLSLSAKSTIEIYDIDTGTKI